MTDSFIARNASEALPALLEGVLDYGADVNSRAGLTKELLHVQVVLTGPCDREVLTPGRKALLPAQIAETMWLLAGRNDIAWLKHYLPRAPEFSDDGVTWRGAYGPRLRAWDTTVEDDYPGFIDQLRVLWEMLRKDPGTRRAVASIYDPRLDLATDSKDIPCNTQLHFIRGHDGALDLRVSIRSNDLMWGWSGINAFAWSAVLEIMAHLANMEPGLLVFNQGSLHLYERSWEKAKSIVDTRNLEVGLPEEALAMSAPRFELPASMADVRFRYDNFFGGLISDWFKVEELIRLGEPGVTEDIAAFPEPMLRSWLWVLYAWNGGEVHDSIRGTRLHAGLEASPGYRGVRPKVTVQSSPESDFAKYVGDLHERKDKAYGDSWKRRGEQVGILANIARKVDRLGTTDDDETALDTSIDLLVYLLKYDFWLAKDDRPEPVKVREALRILDRQDTARYVNMARIAMLRESFDRLLQTLGGEGQKAKIVHSMILAANADARFLWEERQRALTKEQLWKDGNATRSWNPEYSLETAVVKALES